MKPHRAITDGPFHEGEIALQTAVGMAERVGSYARDAIRDHMPDQHREFFAQMPFIVMATVDAQGDVWPTLVAGEPGFMHSPDPRLLRIGAGPLAGDPASEGTKPGDAVGLLGIELSTRRRNRVNGTISDRSGQALVVEVEHSFGNCPQYIQLRDFSFVRDPQQQSDSPQQRLDALDDETRRFIEAADTFFVGSYVDREFGRQVDVSHRGGKPGFVRVAPDGTLTVPDFSGNFHFNTLGNFVVNPRAGLLFVDFESGDVLQLTGSVEVITEGPEIAAFRGAERLWKFRPVRIVHRQDAVPLRFALRSDGFSPSSLMTGSWVEADRQIEAANLARQWRPMRIARIVAETPEISSFYLEPADGHGMAGFKPGQHLPVRAHVEGRAGHLGRVYTLSSAPSDGFHRISVRRQGVFSDWLHSRAVGDIIEARAPEGSFHMEGTEKRAAVLIAAGIGATPILSMLRQIVFEGQRKRRTRPTWIIQTARSRHARAFDQEIRELVARAGGAIRYYVVHSAPDAGERPGVDHSWPGRFSPRDLSRFLPFGDYDFYVCGPSGFMQETYDGLRDMGVSDDRVHAESFGPSSLRRRNESTTVAPDVPVSTKSVPVRFTASSKESRWEPGDGTLLEFAEKRGLSPQFGCRNGSCGTCAVSLLQGTVTYPGGIAATPAEGEILLCSTMPADGSDALEIEA